MQRLYSWLYPEKSKDYSAPLIMLKRLSKKPSTSTQCLPTTSSVTRLAETVCVIEAPSEYFQKACRQTRLQPKQLFVAVLAEKTIRRRDNWLDSSKRLARVMSRR